MRLTLRPLIKWKSHDLGADHFPAHVDLKSLAHVSLGRRQICHADVFLQERPRTAGCYLACPPAVDEGLLIIAGDASIGDFKSHEFPTDAFLFLLRQSVAT